MSIGKTLVTVILAAHLLSCLWFWVHCFDALEMVRILRAKNRYRMIRNTNDGYSSPKERGGWVAVNHNPILGGGEKPM